MTVHRSLVPILLILTLLSTTMPQRAQAQDATPRTTALPDGVTIVANGLNNPRNFTWDDAGTLYLSIAGIGGDSMGMIDGSPSGLTGGMNAAVVTLDAGCQTVVSGELPSSVWDGVGWVWGTADVAFLDGQLYQLASGGGSDYGNFDTPAGVYSVNSDGRSTLVADFSAWSRANMPEFVPPDFNADGTLNDMFAGDGLLWAVDAVSGRIITVTPEGKIDLFYDYSVDHRVPTGIVPDGEGGLFVSDLTVIPYPNGAAKVIHVAADGTTTDHWTGLTAITSLAMGPDGALYASELATNTIEEEPFLPPDSGRIVRQTGPDSLEAVVTDLPYPVSIGFGPDGALYLATPAFGSGTGEGQGAILRIDPAATTPISLAGVDLSAPTCAGTAVVEREREADDEDGAPSDAPVELTTLTRIPLAGLTMGAGQTAGVSRTTIEAGGSAQVAAGSGPSVLYVEEGALLVRPDDASSAVRLLAGDDDAEETLAAGAEQSVAAGSALILPAGSRAEIRNDGEEMATLLGFLAAADATLEGEAGVSSAILAREQDAIAGPGNLTLQQGTIPAGGQLSLPAAPDQGVIAALDRGQAVYLSIGSAGAATNRSPAPMEIYLVTITPE